MNHRFQLRGFSNQPSEQLEKDGAMTESINLHNIPTNESVPMQEPTDVSSDYGDISGWEEVIYIHKGNAILRRGMLVGYSNPEKMKELLTLDGELKSINSIGNTLIVTTGNSVHYFLWKDNDYMDLRNSVTTPNIAVYASAIEGEDYEYYYGGSGDRYTGDVITYKPDMGLSHRKIDYERTGLVSVIQSYYNDVVDCVVPSRPLSDDDINGNQRPDEDDGGKLYPSEMLEELWNNVYIIQRINYGKGIQNYPRLCVFAVKLYDGTYVHISTPIYLDAVAKDGKSMQPNGSDTIPKSIYGGLVNNAWYYEVSTSAGITTTEFVRSLCSHIWLEHLYKIKINFNNIKEWLENIKDLISSVDVFSSYSIIPYQNKNKARVKIEKFATGKDLQGNYITTYRLSFQLDPENYNDPKKFINAATDFRLLKSFSIDDLLELDAKRDANGNVTFSYDDDISDDWMASQKSLNYGIKSDHDLISFVSQTYNQRLLIYDIKQKLSKGYGYLNGFDIDDSVDKDLSYKYTFYIKGDNTNKYVSSVFMPTGDNTMKGYITDSLWGKPKSFVSYPDSRCYMVAIEYTYNGKKIINTYKMKPFDLIDASYCFIGYDASFIPKEDIDTIQSLPNEDDIETITDRVWQSEIANPFNFPASGRHAVGDGDVIGIATTTIALSEGQFGSYPLYVFTDKGIWALSTASDGTFSSSSPLSRDVCNSRKSITGIDQAIVFTTNKGLLMLQGSDIKDITLQQKGRTKLKNNDITSALSGTEWYDLYNSVDDKSFVSFLQDSEIGYDYPGARLILTKDDYPYTWNYYFNTESWHKMQIMGSQFFNPVNSYPNCLVNCKSSGVLHLMQMDTILDLSRKDIKALKGIGVTNALSFDSPDMFKSLTRVEVRGDINKGDVKFLVLGSDDNRNWTLLHSLRGYSWKWFKFVVVSQMDASEAMSYLDIEFDLRYNNKIR